MGRCFAIDPDTLDLAAPINGSFQSMPSSAGALILQIHARFKKSVIDPTMGSNFYDLAAYQADPVALIAADMRRALGVLVKAGLIADVKVEVKDLGDGAYGLYSECRDTGTGQLIDLFTEKAR